MKPKEASIFMQIADWASVSEQFAPVGRLAHHGCHMRFLLKSFVTGVAFGTEHLSILQLFQKFALDEISLFALGAVKENAFL